MSDDVQRIVDNLAGHLNRSVIIDTPAIQVRAVSRHFGDEDDVRIHGILQRQASIPAIEHVIAQGVSGWTRTGVIPAAPDLNMKRRICTPIRWRGELLGFMMIIDADGTLTDDELSATEAAANEAAAAIAKESANQRQERVESERILAQLLSSDPDVAQTGAHALASSGRAQITDAVLVMEIELSGSTSHRERSEFLLREMLEKVAGSLRGGTALSSAEGRRGRLVQVGSADKLDRQRLKLPELLDAGLARQLGSIESWVIGTAIDHELIGAARASGHAAIALTAAKRVPGLGPITAWEDLGYYGLLVGLSDEAIRRAVPHAIRRLLEEDHSRDLLGTLEVFLDCAGLSTPASAQLKVHRTTLYYRLGRVEDIAQVDLQSGYDRLTLHIGIKAAKMCGYL